MPVLYSDELQKDHYAPFLSKTACITCSLFAVMTIMPAFLIYRTHNFWIRDSFHYEQPIVTHMNELVVIAYTETETFQAGTTKDLNELQSGSNGKAGVIDIQTPDYNKDGRPEEINVDISLTGVNPSEIKSVVILQTLSYGLRDKITADLKLPLFTVFQTPNGFSKLQTTGTLQMSQTAAFKSGAFKRQIGFEKYHLAHDLHSQDFMEIIREVRSQNVTLSYDIDTESVAAAAKGSTELGVAQISLNMRIPFQQRFLYRLPLLETIKQAWIQYISFFLVFFYIFYVLVLGYAFQNNILESSVQSEILKVNRNYHIINPVKKTN